MQVISNTIVLSCKYKAHAQWKRAKFTSKNKFYLEGSPQYKGLKINSKICNFRQHCNILQNDYRYYTCTMKKTRFTLKVLHYSYPYKDLQINSKNFDSLVKGYLCFLVLLFLFHHNILRSQAKTSTMWKLHFYFVK